MFTIRQILVRMRQGDRDREIARSKLMGRKKLGALRNQAALLGWLDPRSDSGLSVCFYLSVKFFHPMIEYRLRRNCRSPTLSEERSKLW